MKHGQGEASIHFEHQGPCRDPENHRHCAGRWRGVLSLGFGPGGKRLRKAVSARTKTEAREKVRALREDLDAGITPRAAYTVADAVADWLAHGLSGRSPQTVAMNRYTLQPVVEVIGRKPLGKLTAADVRVVLESVAATRSTRTVSLTHNALERTIRHAEANDLVRRNVASLIRPPRGRAGRPSRSLTADQAVAVLNAAEKYRIYAYVVLSLTTGIRTEEARALRWEHVDLQAGTVAVWRSVRSHGDVKTEKSRRTLQLPQAAADALLEHQKRQAEDQTQADSLWKDSGLVFTTNLGKPLDAGNVRRSFKAICRAAKIGEYWTPRELRTSFVSLMSNQGVSTEEIARLVGHASTRTTEVIYRRELRPVIATGARAMDDLLGVKPLRPIGSPAVAAGVRVHAESPGVLTG
jgi:integrase